jgi:hypothetical protein
MSKLSMSDWPLSAPIDEGRMEQFLRVYEREYENGMPSRFRYNLYQRSSRVLDEVRQYLSSDPYAWRYQFSNVKRRCLYSTCESLSIKPNDLPFWLRDVSPYSKLCTRFDLILGMSL